MQEQAEQRGAVGLPGRAEPVPVSSPQQGKHKLAGRVGSMSIHTLACPVSPLLATPEMKYCSFFGTVKAGETVPPYR